MVIQGSHALACLDMHLETKKIAQSQRAELHRQSHFRDGLTISRIMCGIRSRSDQALAR